MTQETHILAPEYIFPSAAKIFSLGESEKCGAKNKNINFELKLI